MKTPAFIVACLFACASFASARVDTVEFTDTSDPGSPVQITGTAVISESIEPSTSTNCANLQPVLCSITSFREQLVTKIVSSKPIVALILHIDIGTQGGRHPLDWTKADDRFFSRQLIMPGEQISETHDSGVMFARVPSAEQDVKPTAEARTVYVEFSDGTTFGDRKFAEHLLTLRSRALELLRQLDKICSTGTENQCSAALAGITENNPFIAHLQKVQRVYGTTRLTKEIHDSLSLAEERLSSMSGWNHQ